jgi:hypothetical protein
MQKLTKLDPMMERSFPLELKLVREFYFSSLREENGEI